MKRRTWLLSALGATGALVVGWGVMPARSRLGSPELMLKTEGDVALNGWIKIAQDGTVVLAMPRSEMGQGIHTTLAALVAEELDVAWDAIRVEHGAPGAAYYNRALMQEGVPFAALDHGRALTGGAGKRARGFQPSLWCAFDASPMSRSTSAGRR